MELFGDTVLPFDLGLKRFETVAERAQRLKREADIKEKLDAAKRARDEERQHARETATHAITGSSQLLSATPLQLAVLQQQLSAAGRTPENDAVAAAVAHALALKNRSARDAALQHAREGVVPTVGLAVAPTGGGPRVVRIVTPESALGGALVGTTIGIVPAPKRNGTTVGINNPIATAAGAVVDAITQLERFTALNPADP